MKAIIEIQFPPQISKQRENDIKRLVQELKEEVELYGGKVTRADLVPA